MDENARKPGPGKPTLRSGSVAFTTDGEESVEKGEDPRVRRTREAIVEAYIALCGERGAGSISVAAIARRAGVNRATFYDHFEDKPDLAGRGLDLVLAELGEAIDEGPAVEADSREQALRRIERIFRILEKRRAFFLSLLSGAAGPSFRPRIDAFIEAYILERRLERFLPKETFSIPRELIPRVISSLFIGLASWWLENPGVHEPGDMARYYFGILARGIETLPRGEGG